MDAKSLMFSMTDPVEPSDNDTTNFIRNRKQLLAYEMIDIINQVGKSSFKNTYNIFINDILKQPLSIQIQFCKNLIKKIQEVFHFKFSENIDISNRIDIHNCLDFAKFIEFNNIDFLQDVWGQTTIPYKDDKSGLLQNVRQIVKRIEGLNINKYSDLIQTFLTTNPVNDLIRVVMYMTYRNYDLIHKGEKK